MRSFNLIEESWIPMLTPSGAIQHVSLMKAMSRGREFTQIVGDVPTQAFAIQRLMLAVLYRALDGPHSVEDWADYRDDWPAVAADVEHYLHEHRHRFCLFDAEAPFFQVADLRTSRDEVSGLEKLIVDVPNGAPFFTTRAGRGLREISCAEGARWLVHAHAFDVSGIHSGAVGDPRVKGGKGYGIGTGWAGQLGGVAVIGSNFADTLLLNLVSPEAVSITTGSDDRPPWERPQLTADEEQPGGREPRGLVDLLTWQSRRVRLVGDPERITGVVLAQGDRIAPQNRHTVEPMTAWRYSEPQTKRHGRDTYMPREHNPERAFWRGLSAILPTVKESGSKGPEPFLQPAVLQWLAELANAGSIPSSITIRTEAVGISYGSNSSVVSEIVHDQLALPVNLLMPDNAGAVLVAEDAVDSTEHAVRALADLAGNLAVSQGAWDTDGARERIREQAYAALDSPFRRWVLTLARNTDPVEALTSWQRQVRALVSRLGDDLITQAGPTAWVGREHNGRHIDSGQADAWFRSRLSKALPRGFAETEEVSA